MSQRETQFLLLLTLLMSGCRTRWTRIEIAPDSWPPPRRDFEVWTGGRIRTLHAVRITADSLTGVPFFRPPDCDSCRISIPMRQIDSLRTGNKMEGFARTVGLVVGIQFVGTIVMCHIVLCSAPD
jgi:hypothetical protein